MMSAPPGSSKTVLLRSWIGGAALAGRAAWVSAGEMSGSAAVVGALRQTVPGSALVRELTAAPDLDGWTITERLLEDVAPLEDRLWLVIDDLNQLSSYPEADLYAEGYTGRARMVVNKDHGYLLHVTFVGSPP